MTEDIRYVTTEVVSCNGNGDQSSLGHPLIFLNLGDQGKIDCPYCSRQFVLTSAPE